MRKKNALKKSDIYAIWDAETCHRKSISKFLRNLIKNKIKIIQIRDKGSCWRNMLKNAHLAKKIIKNKAFLIINDYVDICILNNADGVHLGQKDISLESAKKILGNNKIIGISCHNVREAKLAQRQGADYISLGPIFKTPLKRERKATGLKEITTIKKEIKIPFFIIGGIDIHQMKIMQLLKIKRIAVCRALCQSKDLKEKINQLRSYLN